MEKKKERKRRLFIFRYLKLVSLFCRLMEGTTDYIHDTCLLLKGIRKVSQKVVPLHNGFMTIM